MSILRDIISLKDDLKDIDVLEKGKDIDKIMKRKSISRWSKNAVMQFPVLVSKSVSIDEAMIISKALERNYANMILLITSLMSKTEVANPEEYINALHQNTNINDDSMADIIMQFKESASDIANISHDAVREQIRESFDNAFKATTSLNNVDLMEIRLVISENIERLSESFDTLNESIKLVKFNEANEEILKTIMSTIDEKDKLYLIEDTIVNVKPSGNYSLYVPMTNDINIAYIQLEGFKLKSHKNNFSFKMQESALYNVNKEMLREGKDIFNMNILNEIKTPTSNNTINTKINVKANTNNNSDRKSSVPKLIDNDVKKSNELIPTNIELTVLFKDSNGETDKISFMVGIKAVIHPIDSDEMINNIISGIRNNRKFFNFIRWTSGEISFFKDYLFSIDKIKTDAMNMSRFSSSWWTVLKRRKTLSKTASRILSSKQVLPNTTILLSIEEVDYIKSEYNLDLLNNIKLVKKMMEEYFLIGFVIADNNNEIVHIMFDGENGYSIYSYKYLEKENNSSNNTKDILKLLNKI